jgi:hypothetical protein
MPFPVMLRVRQRFDAPRVDDVPATVHRALGRLALGGVVRPGQSVAIAVGSRGIADLDRVVRATVDVFRELGATPFIVPAMGSHGGGTAAGQTAILAGFGVTESAVGAPIRSSMEVVQLGTTRDGMPVWFDREASAADHVLVVNRVKPHTTFSAAIESGLIKMAVIGLGKQRGAAACHQAIAAHSFSQVVLGALEVVLAKAPLRAGLAVVENADEAVALLEAVPASAFAEREPALLDLARQWMAALPVTRADLLIVDAMGKNVSGSGMDTNVIGRKPEGNGAGPRIRRVFVRALTPETHGNAYGVGFADFTTTRLVEGMDYGATRLNSLTAAHPEAGAIPLHFGTDREAIETALSSAGCASPELARVVRIRNTLALGEVEVSEALRPELRDSVEIVGSRPLAFDDAGNLLPFGEAG